MADSAWIESMQRKNFNLFNGFRCMGKWSLTKEALENHKVMRNTVIRNKSSSCAKGFAQREGIDFEESFAPYKYAQEILKKHGMTSCDSIGTPMATKHLDADLSGTPVDQMKYRSMVRALMYLTTSRPDIVHATCYCARYQAKTLEETSLLRF
ncbi:hypothetical protein Tco_0366082 [Tanacetum coccineum]